MNTPRKLLSDAAKAVGYNITAFRVMRNEKEWAEIDDKWFWNPLEDDGDALRLAADLTLGISRPNNEHKEVVAYNDQVVAYASYESDYPKAWREAITKVAAKISQTENLTPQQTT